MKVETANPPVYGNVKAYAGGMRIGELAARSGVPVKTIRYYEEIGVLAAAPRTPSGYRDYDEPALDRLGFIRAAQAVGLTLGEVRQVVALRERGETPCAHVVELLERRAAEIERRIAEMQRLRGELCRLAERAEALDPTDCDADRVCHVITAGQ
jgi:MerR family transcriptional regulator, copper efflux regulator